MSCVQWTSAGALRACDTLWIRAPSRTPHGDALDAVLDQQLMHRAGPRARVVRSLRLDDFPVDWSPRPEHRSKLHEIRVHLRAGQPPPTWADVAFRRWSERTHTNSDEKNLVSHVLVVLDRASRGHHDELERRDGVTRVEWEWPFDEEARAIDEWLPELTRLVPLLRGRGVDVGIVGVAACQLRELHGASMARPSAWVVDMDEPDLRVRRLEPDLVRVWRGDACRGCAASPRCSGTPESRVLLGLGGPIAAIE